MMLLHLRWLMLLCSARAWHIKVFHPHGAPRVWSSSYKLSDGKRSSAICRNVPETRWAGMGRRRSTATHSSSAQETDKQQQQQQSPGIGIKVIYDEIFLKHRPPPGYPHPECPARVSTAKTELGGLEGVEWATPSSLSGEGDKATALTAIERVHTREYLDEVKRICAKGGGGADFDTYICPDTFEVCVAASSAWMDAAESALNGSPAFALTRPPGHHATAGVGMGFCLVCFAAVAATHALETLGCNRVAMLDFDVHHGNGVAALVKGDERIRYCSIHQGGIFPGSGDEGDSGPLGNLRHLPFFGSGETWETYEAKFEEAVSWLEAFKPELLIVSAGYDALDADELATASLQPEDFGRIGRRLKEVFGKKVAFGLEGGYNLQVTPKAIRNTIEPFASSVA